MEKLNRPAAEINLIFKWAKYQQVKKGIHELELLHNIPRGVKAGVPNIFWALPRGVYHGLYIYVFTADISTRYSQNMWIEQLTKNGYKVGITTSRFEAKQLIMDYYNLPPYVVN